MPHAALQAILDKGEALLGALAAEDYDAALGHAEARGALVEALFEASTPPVRPPAVDVRGAERPIGPLGARLQAQHAELAEAMGRHAEALSGALRQNGRTKHAAGQYAGASASPATLRAHG